MFRRWIIVGLALGFAGAVPGSRPPAQAQGPRPPVVPRTYSVRDLGVLRGGEATFVQAINDSGEVVGTCQLKSGSGHAFLWKNGLMVDLGALDASGSTAFAINAAGQVVGSLHYPSGNRAFVWTPDVPNGTTGTMLAIPQLSGEYGTAYDVNAQGDIVGNRAAGTHGYWLHSGTLTNLPTFGGSTNNPISLNDSGEVVGYALYFHNFSTFLGRRGLYLEDVYVQPSMRGKGVGQALLRALARIAVERNCARFEWTVLDWNQPAIDFYASQGATVLPDWRVVRMTGEALERFAGGGNA